ncbi:hypothetical protein KC217_22190, partial [Mycobacterium tuberculosis]|nr:hypothetical protein [Mycobacterium tuberculosis]
MAAEPAAVSAEAEAGAEGALAPAEAPEAVPVDAAEAAPVEAAPAEPELVEVEVWRPGRFDRHDRGHHHPRGDHGRH